MSAVEGLENIENTAVAGIEEDAAEEDKGRGREIGRGRGMTGLMRW